MPPVRIATPDPMAETLLSQLAAQLPEPVETVVLLDALWLERLNAYPGCKVILFTSGADPQHLRAAKNAGAAGFWYLVPSAEALARVLRGEPAFPETAPVVSLGQAQSCDLTLREMEVLREITAGKTDAEIGASLNLSVPCYKLLCNMREESVLAAYEAANKTQ